MGFRGSSISRRRKGRGAVPGASCFSRLRRFGRIRGLERAGFRGAANAGWTGAGNGDGSIPNTSRRITRHAEWDRSSLNASTASRRLWVRGGRWFAAWVVRRLRGRRGSGDDSACLHGLRPTLTNKPLPPSPAPTTERLNPRLPPSARPRSRRCGRMPHLRQAVHRSE